jgi:hypothetical protein
MRKFVALACVALGLAVVPGAADAAPIGTNACTLGSIYECDLFADYETGRSAIDLTGADPFPDWLVGYSFLLNVGADLGNGIQASDVAHALVIHSWGFELFTPILTSTAFEDVVAAALAGTAIDGTSLTSGQIVGTPIFNGSTQLNGVGYFTTAPDVAMENQINWGTGGFGGTDSLFVHTSLPLPPPPPPPPDPTGVPEPATVTLLGLGAIALALRRRMKDGR